MLVYSLLSPLADEGGGKYLFLLIITIRCTINSIKDSNVESLTAYRLALAVPGGKIQ